MVVADEQRLKPWRSTFTTDDIEAINWIIERHRGEYEQSGTAFSKSAAIRLALIKQLEREQEMSEGHGLYRGKGKPEYHIYQKVVGDIIEEQTSVTTKMGATIGLVGMGHRMARFDFEAIRAIKDFRYFLHDVQVVRFVVRVQAMIEGWRQFDGKRLLTSKR